MSDPAVEMFPAFAVENIVLREKNIRNNLPDIGDLVASIKQEGILEPLIGTRLVGDKVELIAGYRRYHAAKELSLTTVPVIVVPADENRRHRIALIENVQRSDMNPMDKALAIQKMIEEGKVDQREVAKMLGVSDGFVSQHMTLLKLPKKVQGALRAGTIEMGHARQLARVKDEDMALEFLKLAPNLTSSALADKVDFYIQKEKEKEAAAAAREKNKTKAAQRSKLGIKDVEDEVPASKADSYTPENVQIVAQPVVVEALKFYANKFERATSPAKQNEYKYILKGLEIAAGLLPFTP